MRVLIVENFGATDHGQVGVALGEAGAEIDVRKPYEGEALPDGPDEHDAIVVFGGEQSAMDDHIHPYLPALATLMRDFGEADKSVLGICLGSQVLARAYGAKNLLGAAPEFGWHLIEVNETAKSDPVLGGIATGFPIFQWHSDTFTLPEGAVLLASNSATPNQCFRIGRASYGTQFHFEANQEVVAAWKSGFAATIERTAPGWLADYPDHAEKHGAEADATGLAIARAWVATIGGR
ncbi:GMP synthase [Rhizobium sp. KVB221]|uniref:GMP synthase n=1 Tax=Rhizobium setariae TaxID=2801340 RepID=A0A936YR37_9HYPH|nr:type 1 glutamine amidotransferase [Rhizobium setariae]MBL0372679.1 GMP synthase [Rhizobium setariae]